MNVTLPSRWRKSHLSFTLSAENVALLDLLVKDASAVGAIANRSDRLDRIIEAYRAANPQYEGRILEKLAKRINKEMNTNE